MQIHDSQCGLLPVDTHMSTRCDVEIARDATFALARDTRIPTGRVVATVRRGRVRLSGTLDWHYQRNVASGAVLHVPGVTAVDNEIAIAPVAFHG